MPTYHRETWVDAPLEEVWQFYSTADGLVSVTPEFVNLRVERVTGPDGESDPEILEEGTHIEMSMRPFGMGPRQSWTSVITERVRGDDRAHFRDVMEDGPFPHWEHTHRFYAAESADAPDGGEGGSAGETLVSDRVEYELPFGEVGALVAEFGEVGFEPLFRARHRTTRRILEGPDDETDDETEPADRETSDEPTRIDVEEEAGSPEEDHA